jgi:NAD(P)-dependent dehydrogenase (short-subunit alcohol dehydrogenase family)
MTASDGIVLVTGGGRSIGAATATLLAQQGQRVVIVSGMTGINLPIDAGFIAGSTWDACGGLREAPGT